MFIQWMQGGGQSGGSKSPRHPNGMRAFFERLKSEVTISQRKERDATHEVTKSDVDGESKIDFRYVHIKADQKPDHGACT